ncbi:MFS transporter [Clostridium thermarum]|uniref:MFS transporter n=1 Tax=Clostridium thermarum TaxID=1716543 RepID=UPI001122AFA6|nr:MFS transporter [Clostridium thermarum]
MDNKRKNIMIMTLSIMAFFANGDNYAVAPLLINIAKDLNIGISSAAASVTAYMLTFGLFTIIFGPLGDRYGKTKIINIAAFGTAVFSMLGAFVSTLMMVGVVTMPVEIKYFGKKLTILRNVLAFVFSFVVAYIIGMVVR